MEFETYADVIDSYNSGVGVEAGEGHPAQQIRQ